MASISRRTFLATGTAALTGTALGATPSPASARPNDLMILTFACLLLTSYMGWSYSQRTPKLSVSSGLSLKSSWKNTAGLH